MSQSTGKEDELLATLCKAALLMYLFYLLVDIDKNLTAIKNALEKKPPATSTNMIPQKNLGQ